MQKKIDRAASLFQLPFFSRKKGDLLREIEAHIDNSSKLSYIFTPNPEQIIIALENERFFSALREAKWLVPDGMGLIWASQLLSRVGKAQPLSERIAGREVVAALVSSAAANHWTVTVLGGRGYRHLPAPCQWLPGYQRVDQPTATEEAMVAESLLSQRPQILFVAFGAPYQELWLIEHRELLERAGVKVAMTVGGSFDNLLGLVPTAPQPMVKLGLEWLFRLIIQPWRAQRQLRLLRFLGVVGSVLVGR